jgi:hypothetical protein
MPVEADSHHFEKDPDPHLHYSKKSDSDSHSCQKMDPDTHYSDADPQPWFYDQEKFPFSKKLLSKNVFYFYFGIFKGPRLQERTIISPKCDICSSFEGGEGAF